jgi:hypothetical protein
MTEFTTGEEQKSQQSIQLRSQVPGAAQLEDIGAVALGATSNRVRQAPQNEAAGPLELEALARSQLENAVDAFERRLNVYASLRSLNEVIGTQYGDRELRNPVSVKGRGRFRIQRTGSVRYAFERT